MAKTDSLTRTFTLLEAAAAAGERCPQASPHGPLANNRDISPLCHAGRIRSEIYAHNWRVVTILEGPHKGKHTALPPGAPSRPWKITDESGARTRGGGRVDTGSSKRQQPSKPRLLSPTK